MSINIPNKEQWGKMNEHLSNIAAALVTRVDPSTWADIQKAVRAGLAPELFPVGSQLLVHHDQYGDHLYDVVAHNYLKSVHDENAPTMTLLCHDVIKSVEFDNREAFYYADEELPAGMCLFYLGSKYGSWGTGYYYFKLTQAIPKGGQLAISGQSSDALTSCRVVSYANRTTTTAIESVTIGEGDPRNGGIETTYLGTFGMELNDVSRVAEGSNNYKESAIRQFLNSSSAAGSVWSPQTKYDRPPLEVASLAGFMKGLDDDFLSIVGEVVVPCAANNIYESPDSTTAKGEKYTVSDKFYPVSQREILSAEGISNVIPAGIYTVKNGFTTSFTMSQPLNFSADGHDFISFELAAPGVHYFEVGAWDGISTPYPLGAGSQIIISEDQEVKEQFAEWFAANMTPSIDKSAVKDDSALLPYYEGATDADRIKYRDGNVTGWTTRSASSLSANKLLFVTTEGNMSDIIAISATTYAPACTIV